jgi:hypothetical protein
MNVFILNTGRCGSRTFIEACSHITNFSSGHESRSSLLGEERLDYPENHIEADNRLAWFLGRLEKRFGDEAFYVHLTRDADTTAQSFVRRYPRSIVKAYRQAILMGSVERSDPVSVCLDYCDTVNSNIQMFLKDKTHRMDFRLENAREDFARFWEMIGAEGDFDAAIAEFDIRHNASGQEKRMSPIIAFLRKLRRIVMNLPNYLRHG